MPSWRNWRPGFAGFFGRSEYVKAYARGLSRAAALNSERFKQIDLAEIMREHPGVSLVDGKEAADAMKCQLRRMLTVLGGFPERLEHVSNEALDACVARGLNVIQVADVARRAASDFDAQTAAAGSWSSPIVAAFAILGVLRFARRIVWP